MQFLKIWNEKDETEVRKKKESKCLIMDVSGFVESHHTSLF